MRICQQQIEDSTSISICKAQNENTAKICCQCGKDLEQAIQLLDPDMVVGDYQIKAIIDYGSFGAVYQAFHRTTQQEVALKETLVSASIHSFQKEFAILSQLSHDHLPSYYTMFEHNDKGYLVMEFVPGQSLLDVLNKKGKPLLEAVVLGHAMQLCQVLTYLHTQNPPLIHRDIKPANIRLTPEGEIKLVDFGLVKQGLATTFSTRRGLLTPAYAPIEQWGSGEKISPQSDIYSLGAALYHLLTAELPPCATDRNSSSKDCLLPARHYNRQLSMPLSNALMQAMAIHQEQRFQTAAAFQHALAAALGAKPNDQSGGFLSKVLDFVRRKDTTITAPNSDLGKKPINPLFPVTIAEWRQELSQRNTRFGQPNGYWCYVRPGEYAIGGWKTGAAVATITLPGFWIAKYPITVQQYGQFMSAGGYTTEQYWTPNGWQWRTAYDEGKGRTHPSYWRGKNDSNKHNVHPNQPVVTVTWYEVTAFAKWLTSELANELTQDEAIGLPTEAEWEVSAAYDAQGVRHTYPWGETSPTRDWAIFKDGKKPTPDRAAVVGERPAGAAACGAQDMVGNVWEATGSSDAGYPRQSNEVVRDFARESWDVTWRGGAWWNKVDIIRCAARGWNHLAVVNVRYGVRVCVSPRLPLTPR